MWIFQTGNFRGQWSFWRECNEKYTPMPLACLPHTSGACHSTYYPVFARGKGVATQVEVVVYNNATELRTEHAEAE